MCHVKVDFLEGCCRCSILTVLVLRGLTLSYMFEASGPERSVLIVRSVAVHRKKANLECGNKCDARVIPVELFVPVLSANLADLREDPHRAIFS